MLRVILGLMMLVIAFVTRAPAAEQQVRLFYTGPATITITGDDPRVGNQGVLFKKGDTCLASPKGYDVIDGEGADGRIVLLYILENLNDVEGRDCASYLQHEVPRSELKLDDEQLGKELTKARIRRYGNGRCACDGE